MFCSYNLPSIYQVPIALDEQGMGEYICSRLNLLKRIPEWSRWKGLIDSIINPQFEVKIALIGKYANLVDSYVSMNAALRHGGAACQTRIFIDYLEAEEFEQNPTKAKILKNYDGIFPLIPHRSFLFLLKKCHPLMSKEFHSISTGSSIRVFILCYTHLLSQLIYKYQSNPQVRK